jgi:S1-C subfamily serine protease
MRRYIYRGAEYLGTHTQQEAKDLLRDGTLWADDWVSQGLEYISLASWVEQDGLGPHAVPERRVQTTQPPPVFPVANSALSASSTPMLPPRTGKSIRLWPQQQSAAKPEIFSRRNVIFASAALISGAVGLSVLGRADPPSQSVNPAPRDVSLERLRRSIVRIVIKAAPSGKGTGFAIAAKTAYPNAAVIATASHVVDDRRLKTLLENKMAAEIQTVDGKSYDLRTPYFWDSGMDHCAFSTRLYLDPLPLAEKLPEIGDRIYALGFAEGEDFQMVEGVVIELAVSNFRLVTTAKILPGFSGGPMINTQGQVIGMSVTSTTQNGQFLNSRCVPLHELQNLRQRMDFIAKAASQAHG